MKHLGFLLDDINSRLITLDTPGDVANALAEKAFAAGIVETARGFPRQSKTGIALATPVFYKLFRCLFFFRLGTGSFLNDELLTQHCLPVKPRSQL